MLGSKTGRWESSEVEGGCTDTGSEPWCAQWRGGVKCQKKFDWHLRREDWNLFGKNIKRRTILIRESGLVLWDLDEESIYYLG